MKVDQYLPGYRLTEDQSARFDRLSDLYKEWNDRINVISRKDMDHFFVHHLLHSLSIARVISFAPGTTIMDAGTGGGFPGIPLAILFPETEFTLTDSIGKKIKVIEAVKSELSLKNVTTRNERFENIRNKFEFVTGRAVSDLKEFHRILHKNILQKGINTLKPGILYLSGGVVSEKISQINATSFVWNLSDFFDEPYFESKKLIHLF